MITIKSGFIVLSEYRNNRVLLSDVNIVTTIVLLFDFNIVTTIVLLYYVNIVTTIVLLYYINIVAKYKGQHTRAPPPPI